ncbi:ROK family protein [bacterium]|nr:ROK family protein [bacterium]
MGESRIVYRSDKPIRELTYISKVNKIKILNLIRNEGTLSRSEIAKSIGLSLPTVSRLVDLLIQDDHLLVEVGTRNIERGRPPNLVTFAGDQNFVIGMSIGTVHITAVLTDLNAKIVAEKKIPTRADKGFHSIVKCSSELCMDLISSTEVDADHVLGLGVALTGMCDNQTNRVLYSANLGWKDRDFAGELQAILNKPVIVDNDARVMALGELAFGVKERFRDFICVFIGYGIGASFVVNQRLYSGKNGLTGEFGHMIVSNNSTIPCSCGNYGCLDTLASGRAISIQAREAYETSPSDILREICQDNPESISAVTVSDAARAGDSDCRAILDHAADYLGIGLSAIMNLFNPEAIVLGGGLIQGNDYLFERIGSAIKEKTLPQIAEGVEITSSELGERCRVMGAAALIINEILNLNIPAYSQQSTAGDYTI